MATKSKTSSFLAGLIVCICLLFPLLGQAQVDLGPLLSADLQISTGTGVGEKVAVAFDGSRYFLVWSQQNGPFLLDIYGRFLTRAGAYDGDPFLISTEHHNGNQRSPAVAFNGQNYLVVWQSDINYTYAGIAGKTVAKDGTLGTEYTISTQENVMFPQVASDGTDFLVVWADWSVYLDPTYCNIGGQRVAGIGIPIGANFYIRRYPESYKVFPAIGYGAAQYLVVWVDRTTRTDGEIDLYAAFVDSSGTVSTKFPICTAVDSQNA
jgi:hypothetical protein